MLSILLELHSTAPLNDCEIKPVLFICMSRWFTTNMWVKISSPTLVLFGENS